MVRKIKDRGKQKNEKLQQKYSESVVDIDSTEVIANRASQREEVNERRQS